MSTNPSVDTHSIDAPSIDAPSIDAPLTQQFSVESSETGNTLVYTFKNQERLAICYRGSLCAFVIVANWLNRKAQGINLSVRCAREAGQHLDTTAEQFEWKNELLQYTLDAEVVARIADDLFTAE